MKTFVDAPLYMKTQRSRRSTSLLTRHTALVGRLRPSCPELDFDELLEVANRYFTMMSLHCQHAVARKRSIALNMLLAVLSVISQGEVDMLAGDFKWCQLAAQVRTRTVH